MVGLMKQNGVKHKYKNENETIIEFIENAILKSLPKEVLSREELKEINRRRKISDTTRYAVLERAGFKCQCCGSKPLKNNDVILHIDHIIPHSLGGSDNVDNLQVLCDKCNLSKQNRFIINHNINWIKEAQLVQALFYLGGGNFEFNHKTRIIHTRINKRVFSKRSL